MIDRPNLQELRRVCLTLDEAQFFQFAYGVLKLYRYPHPASRQPLDTGSVLCLAVYEWLIAMAGLSETEARNVVVRYRPVFDESDGWFDKPETTLPTMTLAILDRTYSTLTGVPHFYEFGYDQESYKLEEPSVTLTVCNITALYLRILKWVAKLRGKDEPQHHAEEPAGAAHERERPGPPAS